MRHEPNAAQHDHDYVVPDLLQDGLLLVLCGTAPSDTSARARAYYAHPHNRFWPTLHEVGITPHRFAPGEYPRLLEIGIGLTDVAKRHHGIDARLPKGAWAPQELQQKVLRHHPHLLAFTSKRAASEALGVPTGALAYGLQERRIGDTELWVMPSTSPLGANHFRIEPWQELSARYRALRDPRAEWRG